MNRITAEEALAQVGRQTRNAPLRIELLDLEPGEAIEISYDEFNPGAVSTVASSLSRRNPTRKFSVRSRQDGKGCFVICSNKTSI